MVHSIEQLSSWGAATPSCLDSQHPPFPPPPRPDPQTCTCCPRGARGQSRLAGAGHHDGTSGRCRRRLGRLQLLLADVFVKQLLLQLRIPRPLQATRLLPKGVPLCLAVLLPPLEHSRRGGDQAQRESAIGIERLADCGAHGF